MNHINVVREVSWVAPLPWRVGATGKGRRNLLAIPAVPACAAFFWGVFSLAAFGQAAATFVGGIIRHSSSGKPVPEVQVTAHNLNKRTDLATVSNMDGVFTFTNLEPGPYEFEAMKEGFRKSSARAQVGDLQVVSVDLPLQLAVDLSRTAEKLDDPPLTQREKEMLERIDRVERRLAAMEAASISTEAGGAQPQRQLATGPPEPGVGKTAETRLLVAFLKPVAAMPRTALSSEGSQAPPMVQTPARQQSDGKTGRIATPPRPMARPQPTLPGALEAPEPAPSPDNFTPFAFGDFSWLNGSAHCRGLYQTPIAA